MEDLWEVGFQFAGRFTVVEKIGAGAQAEVYKCVDGRRGGQVVALKRYRGVSALEEEDWAYIENEARLLQQMAHRNIMGCYGVYREPSEWVVVLEYIGGVSLESLIESRFGQTFQFESLVNPKSLLQSMQPYLRNPNLRYQYQSEFRRIATGLLGGGKIQRSHVKEELPPLLHAATSYDTLCENIFLQLCDALEYLSAQGVAHRDLKPANLMLDSQLVLKLVDFGLSRKANKLNTFVGTRGFMAPELLRGDARTRVYSAKVDIWAAGATFFSVVLGIAPCLSTHCVPFEVMQSEHGLYIPPDVSQLIFDTPSYPNMEKYIDIFEHCFVVDETQRVNATELKDIARRYFDSQTTQHEQCISVRAIFLGDYGVGKSTLLSKMAAANLREQVRKITRRLVVGGRTIEVIFMDTIGTEARGKSMMPSIVRGVQLCFLVYSNKDSDSAASLSGWQQELLAQTHQDVQFVVLENVFPSDQTLASSSPSLAEELQVYPFYRVDPEAYLDKILRTTLGTMIPRLINQPIIEQQLATQNVDIKPPNAVQTMGCCK